MAHGDIRSGHTQPQDRPRAGADGATVIGLVILLIWVVSPAFAFADFTLRPAPLAAGVAC